MDYGTILGGQVNLIKWGIPVKLIIKQAFPDINQGMPACLEEENGRNLEQTVYERHHQTKDHMSHQAAYEGHHPAVVGHP